MRIIKFRGKRLDNGKWAIGLLVKMWGEWHIIALDDENLAYPVYPDTIGQYTGLKDKNGREIYEGDIVEHKYYNSNRVVKWDDDQAQFDGWYKSEEKYYLIIGNIHESSIEELKKQQQDEYAKPSNEH